MRIGILSILIGMAHLFVALAAEKTTPPNIILMVADDMGWNDVGYNEGVVDTPAIDQLAREGLTLTRFYMHPICSPSRAALMTGRSPARFGVTSPIKRGQTIPADETFMPQMFQAAGYQTVMIGKWHLGNADAGSHPQRRGFDHFYGFLGGAIDYYTHSGPRRRDWQRNGEAVTEEGYSTSLFADEAVRLIQRNKADKPLLLYLPFNAPHGPTQAPRALIEKYTKRGIAGRGATRAASIDAMDQAVGRVLGALEEKGMAEHSLVIFCSDNGAGGRAGASGKLQLRAGKGSLYEGGIRVPCVMRWPGTLKAGSKSSALVAVQDLLPTLVAAASIDAPKTNPLDGENRWPTLTGKAPLERKSPVVIAGQRRDFALLREEWKLIQVDADEFELYDVHADPEETLDRAGVDPDISAQLLKELKAFTSSL